MQRKIITSSINLWIYAIKSKLAAPQTCIKHHKKVYIQFLIEFSKTFTETSFLIKEVAFLSAKFQKKTFFFIEWMRSTWTLP